MNTRTGILLVLLALGLCCTIGPAMADNNGTVQGMPYVSDIQPYTGPIGPDSSLYGLKLAFENLGDTFTFNQTQKLEQEINHTDDRLSELEGSLAANQTDAANRALDQYWQDMNQTEDTLSSFNDTGSQPGFNGTYDTGSSLLWNNGTYNRSGDRSGPDDAALIAAQQRILLHQDLLEHLMDTHPDNRGLARAYNTSLDMEKRFEDRTQVHFDLERDADHHVNFQQVIASPAVRDHTPTQYSWNQTRAIPAHAGSGQNTGQENQVWQDLHWQENQGHYNPDPSPSKTQENWYANNSTGNDNGNGTWDPRYRSP